MARMITRQEAADILNVSAQTISNWVKKGVLNAHYACDGRTVLIDRKSIEKYFDSLEDMAAMEQCITRTQQSITEIKEKTEKDLEEMTSVKHLMGDGLPEFLFHEIFSSVLYVAGESLLNERERHILEQLMDGWDMNDIADDYHLTRTRILQIARRAIHKVATMKNWAQCHKEYKQVMKDNQRLMILLADQQERIRKLEARMEQEQPDSHDMADIADYSSKALSDVLGRRLVHEKLSVRSLVCLKQAEIETVGQLVRCSRIDLLKLKHFGRKCLAEIENFLEGLHLSLGMDPDRLADAEIEGFLDKQ